MSEKTAASTLSAVEFDPFAGPVILVTAPTTDPQREIWTAVRLGVEASLAFNESVSLRLLGPLDLVALRVSLCDLVARHESLRSTLTPDGLTLCIAAPSPVSLPLVDLSALDPTDRESEQGRALAREVETPFDLEKGPLFRGLVLRLGAEDHQAVLTGHHIVVDGFSWGVLVADLARLYSARRRGVEAPLPPAESFAEHARAEAERQRGPEMQADEAYWLKQFAGELPVLDLPADRARPALKTFAARREDVLLGRDLVQQLRKTGAKEGASFFAVMLTAFKVLLHRLTGQQEVIVGMPAAGQAALGKNGLVGHCVNNLPLRTALRPEDPFRDLLKRVRGTMLDAYEHQGHTFLRLLRKLPLQRDPSRQPLAPVAFNVDQTISPEDLRFDGLIASFSSNPRHFEICDLFVNAVQTEQGVMLECQYNADLYDRESVRRWMEGYEVLLRAVVSDPGQVISELPILTESARQQLLVEWNGTRPSTRPDATVHQVFEEQALRRPEAIALVQGEASLTYGTLDRRANQLAHALRRLGVGPDVPVAVCLERSFDTVVALLGVLKAGGGYVPLDPNNPKDRLAYILEDARTAVLVTHSALEAQLPDFAGRRLLVDREREALGREQASAPSSGASPESLCYVIYTSGSTGRPKGVEVPHRALVSLLSGVSYIHLGEDTALLYAGNFAFDVAGAEIWGGLLNGGRCVLHDETVLSGAGLAAAVAWHRVNMWFGTTAIFNSIVDENPAFFRGMRQVGVGGEAMSAAHARRLLEVVPDLQLINMYGPTEATVITTCKLVQLPLPSDVRSVPIGRPIEDTRLYVLDARMQPVPVGVVGELWIGGGRLARGYLNRPDLTKERFVPNPFVSGETLYRSGDLVRYLPNGDVDFAGRADGQVKLRGLRIELGEIEATFQGHPAVGQAAVMVREDRPGTQALVGYLVTAPGATVADAELLDFAARSLPKSMVPQLLVRLERLPLNANGKVDKKALPAPSASAEPEAYVAPRTASEVLLASLWEKALGLRRIGIHDNFFTLGGHSLMAAQVLSRLNREHEIALPFRSIFEASTIARLAALIDGRGQDEKGKQVTRIPRRSEAGPAPVSLMQERVLLLEELDPERSLVHNAPSAFLLEGPLDAVALERSLHDVVQRQEALRTVFRKDKGAWRQIVKATGELSLQALDWRGRPEAERDSALGALLREERKRAFDVENGPLFRAFLVRLEDEKHVLYTVRHATVWDGWSFDIFRHELHTFYEKHAGGSPAPLPDLPVAYSDFAAWHRGHLEGPEMKAELEFWRAKLADHPAPVELPLDRPRPATLSYAGADEWIKIPRAEADAVAEVGKKLGTTSFNVLLAAFKALLHRYTGQRDLLVASPVRNRPRPEIEDVMGLFTNTLMLRTELDPGETFAKLVDRVRTNVLEALGHQELPFEMLAREAPPVRIIFSLQEARHRETALGKVRLSLPHILPPASAVDLNFWLVEMKDGLVGALNYSTDLFDRDTMTRFIGHFRTLLSEAVRDPQRRVAEIPLVGAGETMRLLALGKATPVSAEAGRQLERLSGETEWPTPESVAVCGPDGEVSAHALGERIHGLSCWLAHEGVGAGARVALLLERPLERVEGLLAALGAGATVFPLDGRQPEDRLARALRAAGATHVLAEPGRVEALGLTGVRGLVLPSGAPDNDTPLDEGGRAVIAGLVPGPDGLTTVAQMSWSAAVGVIQDAARGLGLSAADRVMVTPDAGPLAALLPLFAEAHLLLVDDETAENPSDLARAAVSLSATTLVASTATLRSLLGEEEASLGVLRLVATEVLPVDLAEALRDRAASVASLFGAEEAVMWSGLHVVTARTQQPLLGRPLAGLDVLVLDAAGALCPLDVRGELVLRGPTATGGEVRTGELARWRADSTLESLGRADGRLRRRGFAADAGEIRAALLAHEALADALVAVRDDRRRQPRLVAWVVTRPGASYTDTELRRHLRRLVPEALVPQHFVEVPGLARRSDGRLEERALPLPALLTGGGERQEPRTDEERLLVDLWQESLGVSSLSVRDNFFDLGGHSLLALQVVARVEERTGKRLKPRLLLLSSLEQAAAELARTEGGRA